MNDKPEDVLAAEFQKFSTWVNDSMIEDQKATQITTPAYHYTSAGGLVGIVESQELRLSDIHHLNDPTELQHGAAEGVAVMRLLTETSGPAFKRFVQGWEETQFEYLFNQFNIFVGSFSLRGDDLGQWRSYGDDGRGFALGIKPEFFDMTLDIPKMDGESFFVAKVIYGERATRDRHQRTVVKVRDILNRDDIVEAMKAVGKEQTLKFIGNLAAELGIRFLWDCITSKHQAYEHEQEIRLMVIGGRDGMQDAVKFRTRGPEIVPYVSLPIKLKDRDLIHQVRIGPAAAETAQHGVYRLLYNKHLLRPDVIERSTVPYRSG